MSRGFILSDEILDHEINSPAFEEKHNFDASGKLNDLELFTKGQPSVCIKSLEKMHQYIFMILCLWILSLVIGY